MLQMKEVTVGAIGTCCYILWDDARTDCVVIDPGDEPEHIRKAADGRTIAAILLTHGHFDHIGAVRALMTPETELVVHAQDAPMLSNPQENASFLMGAPVTAPEATRLVHEGDTVTAAGLTFTFGTEMEFYLFRRDENGEATHIPYDNAGYMDIAPEDKGENVRREICLTLEQMGIRPECSHHEQGPGQNEIDFRYSDPLTAADNAVTFKAVVNSVAVRNGLAADFSPKPLMGQPGNGMHINISAKSRDGAEVMPQIIAGILAHIAEMTVFLNTREESYHRFGSSKAPRYISWSSENRSQLIRIPAAHGEYRRAELRSPDPLCSPYLAFTLLIRAGLDGVTRQLVLPEAADVNFYTAANDVKARFHTLPETLEDARSLAASSAFIAEHLPKTIIQQYTH